jgi:hypothetical protein
VGEPGAAWCSARRRAWKPAIQQVRKPAPRGISHPRGRVRRNADFQVCCVADFLVGRGIVGEPGAPCCSARRQAWKPAIQQVRKPAPRGISHPRGRVRRNADFQVCCVADFPVGRGIVGEPGAAWCSARRQVGKPALPEPTAAAFVVTQTSKSAVSPTSKSAGAWWASQVRLGVPHAGRLGNLRHSRLGNLRYEG